MERTDEFSDGDPLAFSSRDSSDDVVSDLRVEGVAKTKEVDEYVPRLGDGLLTSSDSSTGGLDSRRGSKGEGLSDGQVGEVLVVLDGGNRCQSSLGTQARRTHLWEVHNVALVVLDHLGRGDSIVGDLSLDRSEPFGAVGGNPG